MAAGACECLRRRKRMGPGCLRVPAAAALQALGKPPEPWGCLRPRKAGFHETSSAVSVALATKRMGSGGLRMPAAAEVDAVAMPAAAS